MGTNVLRKCLEVDGFAFRDLATDFQRYLESDSDCSSTLRVSGPMHSSAFGRGTNAKSLPLFTKKDKGLRKNDLTKPNQADYERELARLNRSDDRFTEFFCTCLAANVLRDVLALPVDFLESCFDPARRGSFA